MKDSAEKWLVKLTDAATTQAGTAILQGFAASFLSGGMLIVATPWAPEDWKIWLQWPLYGVFIVGLGAILCGALIGVLREIIDLFKNGASAS